MNKLTEICGEFLDKEKAMTKSECYQILEVEIGDSIEQIRESYLNLVKVWHPDRFTHDPKLKQKASEKLKNINDAYDRICSNDFSDDSKNHNKDEHSANKDKTSDFNFTDWANEFSNNAWNKTNRARLERMTPISEGALVMSKIKVFSDEGVVCIVKSPNISVETEVGQIQIPTNKILSIDVSTSETVINKKVKKSILGYEYEREIPQLTTQVSAKIRLKDSTIVKGLLLTNKTEVEYPAGYFGVNEIECSKFIRIQGKIID